MSNPTTISRRVTFRLMNAGLPRPMRTMSAELTWSAGDPSAITCLFPWDGPWTLCRELLFEALTHTDIEDTIGDGNGYHWRPWGDYLILELCPPAELGQPLSDEYIAAGVHRSALTELLAATMHYETARPAQGNNR